MDSEEETQCFSEMYSFPIWFYSELLQHILFSFALILVQLKFGNSIQKVFKCKMWLYSFLMSMRWILVLGNRLLGFNKNMILLSLVRAVDGVLTMVFFYLLFKMKLLAILLDYLWDSSVTDLDDGQSEKMLKALQAASVKCRMIFGLFGLFQALQFGLKVVTSDYAGRIELTTLLQFFTPLMLASFLLECVIIFYFYQIGIKYAKMVSQIKAVKIQRAKLFFGTFSAILILSRFDYYINSVLRIANTIDHFGPGLCQTVLIIEIPTHQLRRFEPLFVGLFTLFIVVYMADIQVLQSAKATHDLNVLVMVANSPSFDDKTLSSRPTIQEFTLTEIFSPVREQDGNFSSKVSFRNHKSTMLCALICRETFKEIQPPVSPLSNNHVL